MMRRFHPPSRPLRTFPRGLSLMEVMLSLAILGGALAAIGELIRVGSQAALAARDETYAQLLCESKMAEVVTGLTPATTMTQVPLEVDPDWLYSMEVQPVEQEGLVVVVVTVSQNLPPQMRPISSTFVRWMIDPGIEYAEETEQTETEQTDSGQSTAPGGTSSG